MNFNFSGIQIMEYIAIVALIIFFLVVLVKKIIRLNFKKNEVDVFAFRRTILLFSLAISFLVVFIIFNWSTDINAQVDINPGEIDPDEIEIEIPITREQPKKLPPPPKIEVLDEENIIDDEQLEFEPLDIGIDDSVETDAYESTEKPSDPLPLIQRKEDIDDIRTFVEEMPLFPGCDKLVDIRSRQQCSTEKLYDYIYKYLKYPSIAQETGVEGKVTLKFVVDKKGNVSKVKILRDIGGGCGSAAAKVVKEMNKMEKKWSPGKQAGRPVSVWFTLPVVFKLAR